MGESEKLKSKRSSWKRVRLGCAAILGLVILFPVLCYGSLWLFARYGGEWATISDIPIPENSRLILATYGEDRYRVLNRLFIHDDSPENLRQWFVDKHIALTTIQDFEGESKMEHDGYYGTTAVFHTRSALQEIHQWSAILTSNWWDDFTPSCQAVIVYQSMDAGLADFPKAELSVEGTLFMVRTCWPNVRQ